MNPQKPILKPVLTALFLLCFTGLMAVEPAVVDSSITVAQTAKVINPHQALVGGGLSITSLLRGLLGIFSLLCIAVLFSRNRRAINWKQVGVGLLLQITLAVGILYVPFVGMFFETFGKVFVKILDFTKAGTSFLLGDLVDLNKTGYIFLFQVLPTIIFFSALTSLLYYLNIIQKVVVVIAWALKKVLNISGAEGLTVSANIFLGQTEAPLMSKKYLPEMTRSEIFLVMTAGMATIAGGVLAAYIGLLGGGDPVARLMYAKYLLSASVMAAPAAIVFSKILMPQTEKTNDGLVVSSESVGSNALDAISNGGAEGVKLAVNVAAMLLVFIAFVTFANYLLGGLIGRFTGLNEWVIGFTDGQFQQFNLEFILGMLFTPLAWLMGVGSADVPLVAGLLGKKLIINEFVAYADFVALKDAGSFLEQKSIIMVTFILCGFANISSIGIQIGGIGSLAPNKREWLTQYGPLAMVAGALSSCMSATIV
ncbi:MAG: NupC/NupG family nucleoside CNT transporter, partial [Bacteroidales bacterium]